jgi:hypothetical protein
VFNWVIIIRSEKQLKSIRRKVGVSTLIKLKDRLLWSITTCSLRENDRIARASRDPSFRIPETLLRYYPNK